MTLPQRIVVIGGSAAGMGAAGRGSAGRPDAQLTVYTELDDVAYSPCGIPYVHGKEIDSFERLSPWHQGALREQGIDIHYETRVERDRPGRKASDRSGRRVGCHTTASWSAPACLRHARASPGGDLGGIYYVKNIRSAMEWDKVLDTVKVAVVVEAQPLGVEMATALAHRGIETHLVDPHPWAMAEIADPDIMAPVEESWRELGVHLHFNTTLKALPRRRQGAVRCRPPTARSRPTWSWSAPTSCRTPAWRAGRAQDRLHRRLHRRRAAWRPRRRASAPPATASRCRTGLTGVPVQGLSGSHAYAQGKVAGVNAGGGSPRLPAGLRAVGPGGRQVDDRRRLVRRDDWPPRSGIPYVAGERAGHLARPLLPRTSSRSRSSCWPSRAAAADRRPDGRRRGHQGTRRLPRDGRQVRLTLQDLATMENVYSPAIGALNEPIALAAQNGLDGLRKADHDRFFQWVRQQLRSTTCWWRRSGAGPPVPRPAGPVSDPRAARCSSGSGIFVPALPAGCPGASAARIMLAMPGSHRQGWPQDASARRPATRQAR